MPERAPARYEDRKRDFFSKRFNGVNTQADRTGIGENEFAWLENIMPIGHGNLRVVPHQGDALATLPASTAAYWKYANIAGLDVLIVATAAGGAYQLNLATQAWTLIAAAATFTGNVRVAQWENDRVLIIAGNDYWDWDGTTLTTLGGTTDAPTGGTAIAVYAGRVWISDGRTVYYSAPADYTDFQTASAGGSFIITDDTFKSEIIQMWSANNFLYIFGDSAINVVSDVRVSSGVTLFSNANITASVGTIYPQSIVPYYRTLSFMAPFGVHFVQGATPKKLSDALDGLLENVDFAEPMSGGVTTLFKIQIACWLYQYTDPETAVTRALIVGYFAGKWFFMSQGDALTMIEGVYIDGTQYLYGTDGTAVYELLSDSSRSIATILKSALWDLGDPVVTKQALKAGVEAKVTVSNTTLNISIVSELGTAPGTITADNQGQWINNAGVMGQWINNSLVLGNWWISGFVIYQGDIEGFGRYIGLDIESTSPAFTYIGLLLENERRARWTGRGA